MDLSLFKRIDSDEIPGLLEKAALFGGKIAQPTLTSSLSSHIKSIDVSSDALHIKFFEQISIEKERPISINLNYRNVSFQLDASEYTYEGTTLVSSFPKEAKGLVIRDSERYVLPYGSNTMSSIYRIEKRGGNLGIDINLVDVSERGMGILITKAEEDMLLKNDHIWIKSINNIQLEEPIFGRIVYAINRKYKDNTLEIKAGVSLEKAIPEEVFKELQQLCRLVLTA
jgi:hypothetical protein